jgi:hypothetical protein
MSGKKVMIVFEEKSAQSDGVGFDVYIEGVDTARLSILPRDEWSTAEFWAVSCFSIVVDVLKRSGAFRGARLKKDS